MVKVEDLQLYCEEHFGLFGEDAAASFERHKQHEAKSILLAMRHVAPPILYYESPLSYMTENPAKKFYDGEELPEDQRAEGEHLEHDGAAQNVINYCVIQARYETTVPPPSIINSSINGERVPGLTQPVVGARLVGMVPCSDAFGFDILISDYQAAVKKVKEQK